MYADLPKDHEGYHDLSYLTIAERAYWAGLLDGEGCLRLDLCSGTELPSISLAMTCEKTVTAFKEIFKLGEVLTRTRNNMKDHWKDCYVIKMTTHKAAKVCEALLPYFITKKEIAEKLSTFYIHSCEICHADFWRFQNQHTCSEECRRIRKMNYQKDLRKKRKGLN